MYKFSLTSVLSWVELQKALEAVKICVEYGCRHTVLCFFLRLFVGHSTLGNVFVVH